jgi:hypothetical protein
VTQFMEGAGHEDDGRSIMLGEPPATKGRHNNITFPSKSVVSFIFGTFLDKKEKINKVNFILLIKHEKNLYCYFIYCL